jgi:hypothetical protein
MSSSICPGEESALVTTVPSVLKIIKARASLQSAIAVLPCYVYESSSLSVRSMLLNEMQDLSRTSAYTSLPRHCARVYISPPRWTEWQNG